MSKNIITILITFVLFLSLIPLIFNLSSKFMVTELVIFIILLVFGSILIFKLLSGSNCWHSLFVFFILHIINIFAIYARILDFSSISIPILFALIGIYIAAFNLKTNDDFEFDEEIEQYYEAEQAVEIEKPKKKTAKKKK